MLEGRHGPDRRCREEGRGDEGRVGEGRGEESKGRRVEG